jgi:hypothetical protein
MRTRVPPVAEMEDGTLIKHLELRHEEDLAMDFNGGNMQASGTWRTYHDAMHRLYPRKYDHHHGEARG